jgi:hypothetical protein
MMNVFFTEKKISRYMTVRIWLFQPTILILLSEMKHAPDAVCEEWRKKSRNWLGTHAIGKVSACLSTFNTGLSNNESSEFWDTHSRHDNGCHSNHQFVEPEGMVEPPPPATSPVVWVPGRHLPIDLFRYEPHRVGLLVDFLPILCLPKWWLCQSYTSLKVDNER